jgi:hypothetical protein
MVLTAERHSNIATAYERLAANENTPREQRPAFARKANWHRILARIATLTGPSKETLDGQRAEPLTELPAEALLFSPTRLWAARFAAEAFKGKRQPVSESPRGTREHLPRTRQDYNYRSPVQGPMSGLSLVPRKKIRSRRGKLSEMSYQELVDLLAVMQIEAKTT